MCTFCIQCAHKLSSSEVYNTNGFFLDHVVMSEDEYVQIWKEMALKHRVYDYFFLSNGRRSLCLWELLEEEMNKILRNTSVLGR